MAVIEKKIGERFALYNGDSCEVLPSLPAESIGLSIYSPPFAELYNYSDSPRDLSNCVSLEEFMEHYAFLIREIYRVTKPGRLTFVHCMDTMKGQHYRDFPGDIIRAHEAAGFAFHSRRSIWKDPLRVAIRTRLLSLMHKQLAKDSARSAVAGADYLLGFVKPGVNADPIAHPCGLTAYAGEERPPEELIRKYRDWDDPKTNRLSHWIWRRYASSVWMDIRAGRLLPYKKAKEKEEEKHVCPLQLDVIERVLTLWSNPGDVVLTPFLGIGSEAYCAIRMGRKAIGIELKPSYYSQAVRNVESALSPFAADVDGDMFGGDMFGGGFEEESDADETEGDAMDAEGDAP